jgi:predicted enzyme related to lactoylglutathione lyase
MAAMPNRTSPWPAGVPCWVDLTVSDVPLAQSFYGQVLGWTFAGSDEEFGGYVIGQVDGAAAAGIGPTQQPGLPSAWTLYLSSTDADASAKLITHAGGTLLLPPGDVGRLGRLLVAADPTGAVFGVWQAGTHLGTEVHSEPGGLTWEDLRTPDPASAWPFYRAVFGYETHPLAAAGPDYATFHLAGDPAPLGGMGGMFGQDAPPHWVVYFGVADADAALERALAAGGTVAGPATESSYGRMGTVTDPFGATFMVVQTHGSSPPPER